MIFGAPGKDVFSFEVYRYIGERMVTINVCVRMTKSVVRVEAMDSEIIHKTMHWVGGSGQIE